MRAEWSETAGEVFKCVQRTTIEHLGVDAAQAHRGANIVDDLGADSLDTVELTIAWEEDFTNQGFPIEISDDEAEKIGTLEDAVICITPKVPGYKYITPEA